MSDEENELTEEQRIAQLEKKVSTNKIVLFAVGVLLIIVISVSATSFIFGLLQGETAEYDPGQTAAIQAEIETLKASQETLTAALETEKLKTQELQRKLDNSSSRALKKLMVEQEESNQVFLEALKSGMKDLAYMVPGSRTWYELYEEQVSTAIQMSELRQSELEAMSH